MKGGFRPISWAGGSTESRPSWIGSDLTKTAVFRWGEVQIQFPNNRRLIPSFRFFYETSGINFSIQQPELVERESSRASGPRRGRTSTLTLFGGDETVLMHSDPRLEAHEDVRSTWLSAPLSHPLIVALVPLETWKNPLSKFASLITNNLRISSGRCLAIVRELDLGFFLSKFIRFSEV
jgi:hypothetical protein